MTITINEAGLALGFPKGWLAVKYDAQQDGAHHSTFFERNIKNNFSRKAIDVVAVCPSNTLVFIEVKGLNNKRDFIEKYHDSAAGLFFHGWQEMRQYPLFVTGCFAKTIPCQKSPCTLCCW